MKELLEKHGWTDQGHGAGSQLFSKESSTYFILVKLTPAGEQYWEAKRRGRQASDKVVASGYKEHLETFLKKAN